MPNALPPAESSTWRLRLFGREPGQQPQSGVPFQVSWENAFESLATLPRMFTEPDGSFVWCGRLNGSEEVWRLEGTIFDDGRVVRRAEIVGNCPVEQWQAFLQALGVDWPSVSVEVLNHGLVAGGQWILDHALVAKGDGQHAT